MSDHVFKVLILDDEDVIRGSLGAFFEDCGWIVFEADSGESALKILSTEIPDVALVDVRLGDMLGVEFVREAAVISTKLLFLICTGSPEYESPEDIKQNKNVYDKIVLKPIMDLVSFEQKVRKLVEDRQGAAE